MFEFIQLGIYAFVPLLMVIIGIQFLISKKSKGQRRRIVETISTAIFATFVIWAMMQGWI